MLGFFYGTGGFGFCDQVSLLYFPVGRFLLLVGHVCRGWVLNGEFWLWRSPALSEFSLGSGSGMLGWGSPPLGWAGLIFVLELCCDIPRWVVFLECLLGMFYGRRG